MRASFVILIGLFLTFVAPPIRAAIVITEIGYHPAGNEHALEFIEIHNAAPVVEDLSGAIFSEGIFFEFPGGTVLSGGEYVVICADESAFRARHPSATTLGNFTGRLDNDGEEIVLSGFSGNEICRVDYRDRGRWPHATDGTGHTLSILDPFLRPDSPESWAASADLGGTPGRPNFPDGPPARSAVILSEIFARGADQRWAEVFNSGSRPINAGELRIGTSADVGLALVLGEIQPGQFLVVPELLPALDLSTDSVRVVLFDSTSSRVLDAIQFDRGVRDNPLLDGTSRARDMASGRDWVNSRTPTPGGPNEFATDRDIVISEIFYHPLGGDPDIDSSAHEFVEIHNRGDKVVDLDGYAFTKGIQFRFPGNTLISGGGYLAIARDPAVIRSVYGTVNVTGPFEGALSNDGETLRLVDPLENVVQEIGYADGGHWPEDSDGGGSSLELVDVSQDNRFPSAWLPSRSIDETDWETISYSVEYVRQVVTSRGYIPEPEFQIRLLGSGEFLVDDIQVRRGGTEYLSNGSFEDGLSGWRIQGNHIRSTRTQEDALDGEASLHVVSTGRGDTTINRIEADLPGLTDGSLTITLTLKWLRGSNLVLFSSDYNQIARSFHMRVPTRQGTPGARNSRMLENAGPVIAEVRQTPASPSGGQAVGVTARVLDPDGVAEVWLRHRSGSTIGEFDSVRMFDDGAHDDGASEDGVFGAEIAARADGVVVAFFIEATDVVPESRRWPPGSENPVVVYRHQSAPEHELPVGRIILPENVDLELRSRHIQSNDLLLGSFVFESREIYHNVGIRYRGSPWHRPDEPRRYRLRFRDDAPFHGSRRINVSPSGANLKERAAYYTASRAGTPTSPVPFPRATHFHFYSNHESSGAVDFVEPYDEKFLESWFPRDSDGQLMKVNARHIFDDGGEFRDAVRASFEYRGEDKEAYRWFFTPRSREERDDFSELVRFARLVDTTPLSDLESALANVVDVEQFVRVLTLRALNDDFDTIGLRFGQNAYLFRPAREGRWKLLPWDADFSFRDPSSTLLIEGDPAFSRAMTRPRFQRVQYATLNDALDRYWKVSELRKLLDPMSAVVRTSAGSQADPDSIYDFVTARTPIARSLLPAFVAFSITTNGGLDFEVDDTVAVVEGRGWVDIESILINDALYIPDWTQVDTWRIEIPLDFGRNRLDIFALGREGNLLASDTIVIISTSGWPAPEIDAVIPAAARPDEWVEIRGSGFQPGLRVFFGPSETSEVLLDGGAPDTLARARVSGEPGAVELRVENVDRRSSDSLTFMILLPFAGFIRGDSNLDLSVDLSDSVRILLHLFDGRTLECADAADSNDDGVIDVSDAIYGLRFLFAHGPAPPEPYPRAGEDPTVDDLDCAVR